MPSKKRKYNARFPAGRIKKIMQTDEDVGKVAQAVPIIIYTTPRTLELFVESLLSKAMQVTMARNAKTLSPSHVKQCILAESRFDFLRDLVKNIPDVSAAEEKELMSAESSPNSSRFSDASVPPRRVVREDSNSSSSCDIKVPPPVPPSIPLKRAHSSETELPHRTHRTETVTSTIVSTDTAIDLTKRPDEPKPVRTANFYQETLITDDVQHRSVITVNPTYASPQPSTSFTNMTPVEALHRLEIPVPKTVAETPLAPPRTPTTPLAPPRTPTTPLLLPRTPTTPLLNIDFSKNRTKPEIRVLDTAIASIVGAPPKVPKLQRQSSKAAKSETKKIEVRQPVSQPVDIDHLNSGNLQIDEDYDT